MCTGGHLVPPPAVPVFGVTLVINTTACSVWHSVKQQATTNDLRMPAHSDISVCPPTPIYGRKRRVGVIQMAFASVLFAFKVY